MASWTVLELHVLCISALNMINSCSLALPECTAGNITTVTIADASFPVGYDSTQFDLCLNITVLQDNLAAITDKVVDTSFQAVILNKLNQVSSTKYWTYKCSNTEKILKSW